MTSDMRLMSREMRFLLCFVCGGGALIIIAAVVPTCMVRRSIETAAGPHEQAMVKALAARDVGAARAALAAGANLAAPVKVGDSRDMKGLVWLLVEEMAGTSGLQSGRRSTDPELLEIARAMFDAGADPNQFISTATQTSSGMTGGRAESSLIETAVRANNPALIEVMLRAGLDVKGAGAGEALIEACRSGHEHVAARLVAAGVNVNHRARVGSRTPLSEAVHKRLVGLIDLLERAGAREW